MLKKLLTVVLIAAIFIVQADLPAEAQALPQTAPENTAQANASIAPAMEELEKANLAQVLKPGRAMVTAGTTLEFSLVNPLSSTTAKAGDDVPLRLLRPLMAGDKTLLAEGTIVHAHVTKAKPAGPNCKYATLEWTIDRLSFSDGTTARTMRSFHTVDAKRPIPYHTNPPETTNWFATTATYVLLAPLTVVGVAILIVFVGPFYLGDKIHELFHPSCTTPGKEVDLPATTRVAVVVTKNHPVSY